MKKSRFLEKLAENEEANVQRKVILSSTFPGSPGFYSEYYEGTMALIRRYGMPDFFHTMTYNQKRFDMNSWMAPPAGQRASLLTTIRMNRNLVNYSSG